MRALESTPVITDFARNTMSLYGISIVVAKCGVLVLRPYFKNQPPDIRNYIYRAIYLNREYPYSQKFRMVLVAQ